MRRRRSARKKKNDFAGVASIVILLMVAALFIYVFQALDIGSILFGGSSASPVASSSKAAITASIKPTATPDDSASPASSDTAATGDLTTEDIKINALTLYGVQLGVFDKQDNAQTLAGQLKPQGASGYVLLDGIQYRVIDSVYYTQADAKTVRDQYKAGTVADASLLKVNVTGFTLKVKASSDQITTIRSALASMQSQLVVLIDTQKKAQAKQLSNDDVVSVIRSCADKFTQTDAALTQSISTKDSPVIAKLHEALSENADSLNALAQNSGDTAALLSGLKYNIIDILLKLERKMKST